MRDALRIQPTEHEEYCCVQEECSHNGEGVLCISDTSGECPSWLTNHHQVGSPEDLCLPGTSPLPQPNSTQMWKMMPLLRKAEKWLLLSSGSSWLPQNTSEFMGLEAKESQVITVSQCCIFFSLHYQN